MAKSPRKGGLSGILDAAKSLVLEEEPGDVTENAAPAKAAAAAPAAPAANTPFVAAISAAGGEPADEKTLGIIQGQVFAQPSKYTTFMKMWETLGKPADVTVALKALQVTDPSITPAAVLADINAHLKSLDEVAAKAAADFDAAAGQRLGAKDAEIEQLTAANKHAQEEIERHQKETAERIGKIAQLSQERANDEGAIARAKAKTATAEGLVRSQLQTQQQVFSALS